MVQWPPAKSGAFSMPTRAMADLVKLRYKHGDGVGVRNADGILPSNQFVPKSYRDAPIDALKCFDG
jgi:hypothetical protein